mmetsp:Transcript_31348/g.63618  ORF Transcript_31348/g.63618 Transcript_31348/m.63618 type:complete len:219 (-) Transcript_31348:1274-1930(-)
MAKHRLVPPRADDVVHGLPFLEVLVVFHHARAVGALQQHVSHKRHPRLERDAQEPSLLRAPLLNGHGPQLSEVAGLDSPRLEVLSRKPAPAPPRQRRHFQRHFREAPPRRNHLAQNSGAGPLVDTAQVDRDGVAAGTLPLLAVQTLCVNGCPVRPGGEDSPAQHKGVVRGGLSQLRAQHCHHGLEPGVEHVRFAVLDPQHHQLLVQPLVHLLHHRLVA